jgi:large subunit ribosomal protein L35
LIPAEPVLHCGVLRSSLREKDAGMPKMKTHKGVKRRVRVTATGKVRYKRSFASHLMSGKSGDRVRRARRPRFLTGIMAKRLRQAVGE